MKISMAMTEENAPPECGSFVAHCTLEFDDEPALSQGMESSQRTIHAAIAACCRTIHDELRRQQPLLVAATRPCRSLGANWTAS
jgi:hypothetical protein